MEQTQEIQPQEILKRGQKVMLKQKTGDAKEHAFLTYQFEAVVLQSYKEPLPVLVLTPLNIDRKTQERIVAWSFAFRQKLRREGLPFLEGEVKGQEAQERQGSKEGQP